MNVFDELIERGYLENCTHEDQTRALLESEKVRFYIGFDATADSLHVGHFIQLMVMMRMQEAGHTPIALIGGGTTLVGDPSGKTDMRQMLSVETIRANGERFRDMFSRFLDFEGGRSLLRNNIDWLGDLNYIEFLRDIGPHFSVNRMLAAEAYKNRMETGLTFLEFNYMIMQAFDFYMLYKNDNCKLQFGGSDQWSNIIAGVELIRRKEQQDVYGLTFSLLTNSQGVKMGKTVGGALWLDAEKTSPYEFFQYFRNLPDADIEKCLWLLTFLPSEEVKRLASYTDEKANEAKEALAFEVTRLVHGEAEAVKARDDSRALFTGQASEDAMPTFSMLESDIGEKGIDLAALMVKTNLASSRSEARRLIEQGGITVNGEKEENPERVFGGDDFGKGLVLRKGKKIFLKVNSLS